MPHEGENLSAGHSLRVLALAQGPKGLEARRVEPGETWNDASPKTQLSFSSENSAQDALPPECVFGVSRPPLPRQGLVAFVLLLPLDGYASHMAPFGFSCGDRGEAREKLAKRRADGFFEGNTSFGVTSSSSLVSKTATSETADAREPQGPLKRRG